LKQELTGPPWFLDGRARNGQPVLVARTFWQVIRKQIRHCAFENASDTSSRLKAFNLPVSVETMGAADGAGLPRKTEVG
jgi:hypothetical protein